MSRKITFLTLFLWLMTVTFPVIAQQKADTTYTFRFVPREDMFYVPWNGNDTELARLLECIEKNKATILDGKLPLLVDGYCNSLGSETENLATAIYFGTGPHVHYGSAQHLDDHGRALLSLAPPLAFPYLCFTKMGCGSGKARKKRAFPCLPSHLSLFLLHEDRMQFGQGREKRAFPLPCLPSFRIFVD